MTWNDAKEAFAATFTDYQARPSQDALAEHIEKALADGRTIAAQAPTGTGKSLAAMVPAIDFARVMGKPVCASTGTKNLQDQYIRDMETLKGTYFPDLKYVVLKGRSNYLCQAKLAELEKSTLPETVDVEALRKAGEAEGVYGDVERLGIPLSSFEKGQVTISSEECPGAKACPFAATCFAERIKTKAEDADVVISNHALVAINEVLKAQNVPMLPDFSARVIDEAHEFEGYVSNALSTQLSERSLTLLATRVAEFTGEREIQGETNIAAKRLFDRLRFLMANRDHRRETTVAITPAVLIGLNDELSAAIGSVQHMQRDLAEAIANTEAEVLKRKRLRNRVRNMEGKLRQIILADFDDMVRWIEREERKRYDGTIDERITLCQAPLEIAGFLQEHFWADGAPTTVLVSATLAVGDDFSYLAGKLGMSEYDTFDCPTPFDYPNQAMIYAPKDLPDPSKESSEYQSAVNLHLGELVRASDGRALLLFTSWESLNSTHRALAPVIGGMGHRVLKQGEAPPRVLAESFKNDEHSVLFATKSFFTGVDIAGDSLRLLAIVKLPFPVRDVLFDARCTALDEKVAQSRKFMDGSFMKLWVPEMIMTLTQGVGRLIRTVSDRGLVAILDPRLHSKPSYGRKTLRAIQTSFPAPLVVDLQDAVSYLHTLEAVSA